MQKLINIQNELLKMDISDINPENKELYQNLLHVITECINLDILVRILNKIQKYQIFIKFCTLFM